MVSVESNDQSSKTDSPKQSSQKQISSSSQPQMSQKFVCPGRLNFTKPEDNVLAVKRVNLVKAAAQKTLGESKTSVNEDDKRQNRSSTRRTPISATIKHKLILKHNGQCTHVDRYGQRCEKRRFLDIHHQLPVAKDGTNDLSNLTLLCRGHHRALHFNE